MIDKKLQSIIHVVNNSETAKMNVTVFVGGLVFTGDFVSAKKYFDYLEEVGVIDEEEIGPAAAEEAVEATFIHLEHVSVVTPGEKLSGLNSVMWRCKLDAVDAWFPGAIEGFSERK